MTIANKNWATAFARVRSVQLKEKTMTLQFEKQRGKFKNTLLFRRMEINENPANFGNYIFNLGEINKDSISAKSDNIKKLYFHLGKWK